MCDVSSYRVVGHEPLDVVFSKGPRSDLVLEQVSSDSSEIVGAESGRVELSEVLAQIRCEGSLGRELGLDSTIDSGTSTFNALEQVGSHFPSIKDG